MNRIKTIKPKKRKRLNPEEELNRLLGKVWRNPYDVLDLPANSTEEQIRRKFRMFTIVLHPDKCSDTRATDAFTIVEQSYKTLLDPNKRKLYQRIMVEAKQKTEYERQRENKKRKKLGQPPLPDDTFEVMYKSNTKLLFDEIEEKRNHYIKLEQGAQRRRQEEIELLTLKEQYRLLTEEEWEKSRDKRIDKWRKFTKKKGRIGSKGTNGSIRSSFHRPEIRTKLQKDQDKDDKPAWVDDDYKKMWK